MAFSLRSASFEHEGAIPAKHTCQGDDTAPALVWSGAPAGTKSFALIVDDPDAPDPRAPKTTWVHWVLYNLPPTTSTLPEAATAADLPPGTQEGINDFGTAGFRGPCPPTGRHRYFHKLYALDTVLADLGKAKKADVEKAMRGHVIGEAQLVGTYEKGR
jgi:Raf kinase inhibitor-like YbhB/YbcL family protein